VTDDPDVLFAIVATPLDVRIELIRSLAQSGKHILLEKPVARTLAEAIEVAEISGTRPLLKTSLRQYNWNENQQSTTALRLNRNA